MSNEPEENQPEPKIANIDTFFDENEDPFSPTPKSEKNQEEVEKEVKPDPKPEEEDELELPARPKQKNTKEESNAILKKQNNDLKTENESFRKSLGDIQPGALSPIIEYIKENIEGVVDATSIASVIEELKSNRETIQSLETKLQEKDKFLEEVDIKYSPDFQENYQRPYKEAGDAVYLEFATVANGKIIGEKSAKSFANFIFENADKMDGIALKSEMKKYAEEYEKETGEKAELPSVSNMMGAIRTFSQARKEYSEAVANWTTKKKESKDRYEQEQLQQSKEQGKQKKQLRKSLATKAFTDFPIETDYTFLDDKEVKDLFTEEYKAGEKLFDGEGEIPSYDIMMSRGVKARLFDKIAPLYKKLLEEQEHQDAGNRHRPSHKGVANPSKSASKEEKDWLVQ